MVLGIQRVSQKFELTPKARRTGSELPKLKIIMRSSQSIADLVKFGHTRGKNEQTTDARKNMLVVIGIVWARLKFINNIKNRQNE